MGGGCRIEGLVNHYCIWNLCCSVLQCVAVCCSVLQCVALRCRVLQCVAARFSVLQTVAVSVCCSVLQCVAVCCSALQCVAVHAVTPALFSGYYGVATISRLLQIKGLFCRMWHLL